MKIENNLQTITNNLTDVHLSLALDALFESRTRKKYNKHSISAIIHSYCGLESALNHIGYQMFFNKNSEKFVGEDKRDIPLTKMIRSWNSNLQALEKINYILSVYNKSLPPDLENKLRELNNLRNWLIHGFSYETTFLLEPTDNEETNFDVIDWEDNVDWNKKFPNNKFNPLSQLDSTDAEKALRLILEILLILANSSNQPFSILSFREKINFKILHGEIDLNDIINPK